MLRAITQVRHGHWKRNSSDPHWIRSFVNQCVRQKRSLCVFAEKGPLCFFFDVVMVRVVMRFACFVRMQMYEQLPVCQATK